MLQTPVGPFMWNKWENTVMYKDGQFEECEEITWQAPLTYLASLTGKQNPNSFQGALFKDCVQTDGTK